MCLTEAAKKCLRYRCQAIAFTTMAVPAPAAVALPPPPPYEATQYYSSKTSTLLKAQRPFTHQSSANATVRQQPPSQQRQTQFLSSEIFEPEKGNNLTGNAPPLYSSIVDYDLYSGKEHQLPLPPPYYDTRDRCDKTVLP